MVVAAAVLALLVLPVLATSLAARPGPRPSDDVVLPPLPADARGGTLTDLPAGLPGGLRIRTPEDLRPLAVRALGAPGGDRLVELLAPTAPFVPDLSYEGVSFPVPYPYRYPVLEELLDGAPAAARTEAAAELGAALVVLAARPTSEEDGIFRTEYRNAAAAAFALLDRARAGGGCEAQLNLLLLVAADSYPRDDEVQAEADRSAVACPGDPTPYWLLGQFQSQRAEVESPHNYVVYPLPEDAMGRAPATSTALLERHPAAPAAWSGAADAHVRAGLVLLEDQPFTARQEFRTAEAQYRRAQQLGDSRDAMLGLARVLTALGEPEEALRILGDVPARGRSEGPVLELLTTAAEAVHRFDEVREHASRLADLGTSAYPSGAPLFPVPGVTAGPLFEAGATAPLSAGAGRFTPFTVDLAPEPGGAGGSVDDVSFIPLFRPDGFTDAQPMCPEWVWRRSAMLAGDAASALEGLPESFRYVRPDLAHVSCGPSIGFYGARGVLELEAGIAASDDDADELGFSQDTRQNLWRWAGGLARAEDVVREWADEAGPDAFLPMLRLGEVEYLRDRYDAAAADFDVAARRYESAIHWAEARLDRGVALLRAGRHEEATVLLREVDRDASADVSWSRRNDPSQTNRLVTLSFHARAQLADAAREAGELHASAEFYAAARERLPWMEEQGLPSVRPERVHANEALTLLALDRVEDAMRSIDRARTADPANPAFQMTAGFVADRAGWHREAAVRDAAALRSDAGAYPAANDLGVELARLGDDDGALDALRQAVAARPDYALGWFNLGVLHGRQGPLHLLAAQGALAHAFELDPSLRDRARQLTIDAGVYRTGLDLSKPLPPRWSLADAQRQAPAAAAGLLAVCLVGLGLARSSIGGDRDLLDKVVEPATSRLGRLPLLGRLRHPGWALAATPVVFLLATLRDVSGRGTEQVAYGLGILVVAVVAVRARMAVARRADVSAVQETWAPGVVLGMATGAAGLPWAPLPVVRTSDEGRRVHWAAPVALALLGIVLFIEAAWLPVPLTRSLAVATLIMAASVLVPISPLDGKEIGKGGALAGAGVVGAAALIVLGLV
jgi:tetratricopeptide (TPR) repeat protein